MARPIEPTPILKGREAKRFDERLINDLRHPVSLVPTPKLDQARELVLKHAIEAKKLF